jgi:mRNA interferase RelE/StbE
MYKIIYHPLVVKKDIPNIDNKNRNKIKETIEKKLINRPEIFSVPLRTSLSGYRKLRVGDYRVILKIQKKEVKILMICHRSVVYKQIYGRVD